MREVIKVGIEMTVEELLRMDMIYKYQTQWGDFVYYHNGVTYIAEIKDDKAIIFGMGELK